MVSQGKPYLKNDGRVERREDEESREGYREEEAEWVTSSAETDVMALADVFHYKKRFYVDLNHLSF